MMRFQQAFVTGFAALLALPAVAVLPAGSAPDDEPLDLFARLEQTARAIERVTRLETRLQAADHDAVAEVLDATEAPVLDGPERDATLVRLRGEVGALQEQLDGLAVLERGIAPPPTSDGGVPATRPVTTGLGDAERRALSRLTAPGPDAAAAAAQATDFERDPSYSADALHQARLYLRLGRAAEAIGLLAGRDTPEARYWLARAYERSDLHDEALAIYEALAVDPDAGVYVERARIDRDFLKVKRELRAGREKREGGS